MGEMRLEEVRTVACSHCGARPGEFCKDPKGKPYYKLHVRRWYDAELPPPGLRVQATPRDPRRTYWSKFGACPECGAFAGNPCRGNSSWLTGLAVLNKAHRSRPKD